MYRIFVQKWAPNVNMQFFVKVRDICQLLLQILVSSANMNCCDYQRSRLLHQ